MSDVVTITKRDMLFIAKCIRDMALLIECMNQPEHDGVQKLPSYNYSHLKQIIYRMNPLVTKLKDEDVRPHWAVNLSDDIHSPVFKKEFVLDLEKLIDKHGYADKLSRPTYEIAHVTALKMNDYIKEMDEDIKEGNEGS